MVWKRVKISSFMKERPDRIKPDQANELGLHRLEKIDFSGRIHLNENKPTRTGMILVKKGDLVCTPPYEIHALKIIKKNKLLEFSDVVRTKKKYQDDVIRIKIV